MWTYWIWFYEVSTLAAMAPIADRGTERDCHDFPALDLVAQEFKCSQKIPSNHARVFASNLPVLPSVWEMKHRAGGAAL
jgi:hypothetical protein